MKGTILRLLEPDHIQLPLIGGNLDDIVSSLVGRLNDSRHVLDADRAVHDVLAREHYVSTCIGDGIAMPHARTRAVTDLCAAMGIAPSGINLPSHDDAPIQVVVMMLVPPSHQGPYIRFLAEMCHQLRSQETRQRLLSASTTEEVVNILSRQFAGLPNGLSKLLSGHSAKTDAA